MRRGGVDRGVYSKSDPEVEMQALRSQAEVLQSELNLVQRRLRETEAEAGKKE
jgi:hypothetical protein